MVLFSEMPDAFLKENYEIIFYLRTASHNVRDLEANY
jgi:hypothetical protein